MIRVIDFEYMVSRNTIFFVLLFTENLCTYKTVPRTARVPENGASTFQESDKESNNIEAAWKKKLSD